MVSQKYKIDETSNLVFRYYTRTWTSFINYK